MGPRFGVKHPVIFLHLPKTAGTTFNAVLARQYAGQCVYGIKSDALEANIERFKQLPEADRHRIRLLLGHQAFGLHEYLAPGARYITVLRDPVARLVSHYQYVKSHRHPKFIGAIEGGQLDVLGYVTCGISGELENGQTRWLCGRMDDAPLGEADLERAIANLECHFDWVGLTERFDESLVDLAIRYRWPRVYYRSRNVGGRRGNDIDPCVREAVLERNALDLRLYEYVARRMDRVGRLRAATRRAGAGTLRLANALGQRIAPPRG